MSSLALYPAHLLLHPAVSRSLAVLSKTIGRDKLYRLVQYASRLIAGYMLRAGRLDDAARWTALKAALAMGRKLMRIGKPLEHAQAAIKLSAQVPSHDLSSALGRSVEIERITQIARQLAYFGYLATDSVLWLQYARFLRLTPKKVVDISTLSNRLWLAGIVLSLASSGAGMVRVRREARRSGLVRGEKDAETKGLIAQRAQLGSQMLLDGLDLFIPANNLGLVTLDDRKIGAIGVVTSWMALKQIWAKA